MRYDLYLSSGWMHYQLSGESIKAVRNNFPTSLSLLKFLNICFVLLITISQYKFGITKPPVDVGVYLRSNEIFLLTPTIGGPIYFKRRGF